jgi:hypothetical protein
LPLIDVQVCTPANWRADEEVFIDPALSMLEAADRFAKGFIEIKPWFRLTAPPDDAGAEAAGGVGP